MLYRCILVLLLAAGFLFGADQTLHIDGAGVIKIDDVSIRLMHFAPRWKLVKQSKDSMLTKPGFPAAAGTSWNLEGMMNTHSGECIIKSGLVQKEDSWEYTATGSSESGLDTLMFGLCIELPKSASGRSIMLNGKSAVLPKEQGKQNFASENKLTKLEIPLKGGNILVCGFNSVKAGVTDERKWGGGFEVRIGMPVSGKKLTSSSISMTLSVNGGKLLLQAAPPDPKLALTVDTSTWSVYEHFLLTEKGSAVDFSFMLDAPAGKHGPVQPDKSGNLVFGDKPDEEFRIYGTNVVYGTNFPDQKDAALYAEQIARLGYNALRFHHFDGQLDGGNGKLNPDKLDRLDKFAYELKKRGIYLSIDLYSERTIKPGTIEGIDVKMQGGAYKGLVPIYKPALEDFRRFTSQLLTHVNPYSGIAWKDDPALVSLCLLNEGNIYFYAGNKVCKPFYQKAYKKWCEEKGKTDSKAQYNKFLTDVSIRFAREQKEWISKTLGSHVLVTDTNFMAYKTLAPLRNTYDLVDNHMYVDHPDYMGNWNLPWKFNNKSAMTDLQRFGGELFPSRIFGKPFTVTEFNYCYPNEHRAEGGIIMGAYAALQGWNGVFRFDYGGHKDGDVQKPVFYFSTNRDPIAMFSDRFGKLMFLSRGVKTGLKSIPMLVDADAAVDENVSDWNKARVTDQFRTLGLYTRIGIRVLKKDEIYTASENEPFVILGPGVGQNRVKGAPAFKDGPQLFKQVQARKLLNEDMQFSSTVSETRELRYDKGKEQLRITAPTVEILISPEGNVIKGRTLEAEIIESRAAVGIASLDGKPLQQSSRLLLVHLTDVQNSGITFRTKKRKVMTHRGKAPMQIRGGKAAITLLHSRADTLKVFALDGKGKQMYEVKSEAAAGNITFSVSTISERGNSLSYEIRAE